MSPTKEDYLKILFELGGHVQKVSNKKIAEKLNISPPTVTEMMNSLVKTGWVSYTPYKGSQLTDEGAQYAKALVRKHRLWEVFLVDELGFEISEVHEEAELLEHSTTDIVADRLEKFLNYPKFCPHGGAISLEEMGLQEKAHIRLNEAIKGAQYKISRIVDDETILTYFKRQKLDIGDVITIAEKNNKLGIIHIQDNSKNLSIDINIQAAENVFVNEV